MEWTDEQAQGVVAAALKRAAIDAEFRRLALRDANAAIEQMTGKPLPEGLRVRVLARDGYDVTLVLPDPAEVRELADEELEQVAGGTAVAPGGSVGMSVCCDRCK